MFEGISEALYREMESIDNKLQGGKAPMTTQDLDSIDKMAHALKCLKAYEAMLEGEYPRARNVVRYDGYPKGDYRRY